MYHECIHVSIPNKFLTELILSFWIPNISSAPSKMIFQFLHFQISLASWACTLDAPQTVQSPAILPGTRLEAGLHCRCNIFGFAGFSISNYLIIFIESSFWCSQTLPLSLLLFENFKIRMFQKLKIDLKKVPESIKSSKIGLEIKRDFLEDVLIKWFEVQF